MTAGRMKCPKCGAEQPAAPECRHCGVIVAKALAAQKRRSGGSQPSPPRPPEPAPTPRRPVETGPRLPIGGFFRTGLSTREKALLFSQLARMLNSGLALVSTLESTAASVTNRRVRAVCAHLVGRLHEGASFGAALEDLPRDFDPHEVGSVKAGEIVGELPDALDELAGRLERRMARWRRILVGLAYPLLLLNLSFFLLPIAQLALGHTGAYFADALTPFGVFVGVVLGALLLRGHVLGHPRVAAPLRRLAVTVPGLSQVYRRFAIATFYAHLGQALRAGQGPEPALRAAAKASAHPGFLRAVERSVAVLDAGGSFAESLRASGIASDSALLVVTGGEAAGELDQSLAALSTEAEARLDAALQVIVKVGIILASVLILGFVGLRIFEGMQNAMNTAENMLLKELPGNLDLNDLGGTVNDLMENLNEATSPGYQPIPR